MLFFLVLLMSSGSAKRCRGRLRSGQSCSSRCNYKTGQWEQNCGSYSLQGFQNTCKTTATLEVLNPKRVKRQVGPCSTDSSGLQVCTHAIYCQLPFKYEGELMRTCILKNSVNNTPWCPTQLDENHEMVPGQFAECHPDNDMRCREIPSECFTFCENPSAGVTTCSYEFSGGSKLGIQNVHQFGKCSESYKRAPCFYDSHDYCNDACEGCDVEEPEPLKCYQCNSYKDSLCADPFYYKDDVQKRAALFLPCPKDEDAGMKQICTKITLDVHGNKSMIRSCGYIRDDQEELECYSTVLEGSNSLVCQCESEGCNSARIYQDSTFTILSAVMLSYVTHY